MMRKFIAHILKVALASMIIGACTVFALTGGELQSAIYGAIFGGVPGALIGLYTGASIGRRPSALTGYADSTIGSGHAAGLGGHFDAGGIDAGGSDAGGFDGGF